jgi:hypothetical protein
MGHGFHSKLFQTARECLNGNGKSHRCTYFVSIETSIYWQSPIAMFERLLQNFQRLPLHLVASASNAKAWWLNQQNMASQLDTRHKKHQKTHFFSWLVF